MPVRQPVRACFAVALLAVAGSLAAAAAADAQRLPFERTFTVGDGVVLDASTVRGKIDVSVGASDRVQVNGTVTVRVDTAPADALAIAQRIAADPPMAQEPGVVRLRAPLRAEDRRAVTVAYAVKVPRGMRVTVVSESGELTVADVAGGATLRTQSGAVGVRNLGGPASVESGSGAVEVDGIAGDLKVSTQSSGIKATGLSGGVTIVTQSGAVHLGLNGRGNVTVSTGSGEVKADGVRGALSATTQSGRVTISGEPLEAWTINTGSASVALTLAPSSKARLDLATKSSSIVADDPAFVGSFTKKQVTAQMNGGGPDVRVTTRSGSIRARAGGAATKG